MQCIYVSRIRFFRVFYSSTLLKYKSSVAKSPYISLCQYYTNYASLVRSCTLINKYETRLVRCKSTTSNDKDELGSSSLMLQDGLRFEELPLLVRKTNRIPGLDNLEDSENIVEVKDISNIESEAVCKIIRIHLNNIMSVSEVLRYLQFIPSSDVTPSVALIVFERIMEIHHSYDQMNPKTRETFAETAVLGRLCEIICRSSNTSVVLSGLDEVNKITKLPIDEKARYHNMLVTECLLRANKSQLNLLQLCDLVQSLKLTGYDQRALPDNLWQEIISHGNEVTIENISKVFGCLPYLKSSQRIVLSMLEKHVFNLYPKLSERQIVHMLQVVCLQKIQSRKLCYTSTAWVNLNIHKLTEIGLRDIITMLTILNYSDETLNETIRRFMKAKGSKCTDTQLMTALAEYCVKFRYCCPDVLESISQYFIKYANCLPPQCITVMVEVFGYLNYKPLNAYQFFETLEKTLMDRIGEFQPGMIISMLLSCVYIQRYPLNFAKFIFQPHFLDKLSNEKDDLIRYKSRKNLKLLDVALTLECLTYSGPFLPRNRNAKSFKRDCRIDRISKQIVNDLSEVLGGLDNFRTFVVIPKLPLIDIYIVDFAININEARKPIPFDRPFGIFNRVVLIIILPEYYIETKNSAKKLIGIQATRIRQLELLGYKVITLDYTILEKFSQTRSELKNYFKEQLSPYVCTASYVNK